MNTNAWNYHGDAKPNNNNSSPNSRITTPIVEALRARPDTVGGNYLVAIGSRTARFRRKKQHKIIIVILIILLFILLIILIVLFHYASKRRIKLCETPQCIRSASNLILSMDQTADPCEDFYQYACGNWHNNHPKPDFLSSYDWFTDKRRNVERMIRDVLATNTSKDDPKPFNQAKEMYAACIDTKAMDAVGLQPIFDFLKSVNLPLIPTFLNMTKNVNYETYDFDWMRTVVKIKKKMGLDMLIGFDIYPDPRDNSKRRILIGEPSDADPFPSYHELDRIISKSRRRTSKRKKRSEDSTSAEEENDDELEGDDEESEDNDDDDDEDEDKEDAEHKKKFKEFFSHVMKIVLSEMNKTMLEELDDEQIDKNINKTLETFSNFTKSLYKISEELDNSTVISNTTDVPLEVFDYTVDKLQAATDEFFAKENTEKSVIWKPYLQGIFNGTNVTLDFSKDLILFMAYDFEFSQRIALLIKNTPPVILELYIWLQVMDVFIPYTISPIRLLYEQYLRSITGLETMLPRSMRCASAVSQMMGFAVAYGVADKNFFKTTLPKVEKMLSNIKYSFEDLISDSTWMDLPTKSVSIEKVRNMKSLIGFPQWILSRKKLENYYKGLYVDPEKHIQNQLSLKELMLRNKLNNYRTPFVFDWDTEPTEVNAYHTFQANTITLPFVMLEYPFYDLGLEALNYGSIGTVLGHELTHGFDNYGRQYDKNGVLVPWWTNKTIESFVNKTECLAKQYSSFYVQEVDKYVDGNQTLGENIADNGGLRSALKGYWKEPKERLILPGLGHLTNEQLFFLSYGNLWCGIHTQKSLSYDVHDEHSPSHLRLKGTLQNMPEFAKAWKCRANSTMNPNKRRCVIF